MTKKYFFIPGRNKALSTAELSAVLGYMHKTTTYKLDTSAREYFILDINETPEGMTKMFDRLGGFIKFGEILDLNTSPLDLVNGEGKVLFGISGYVYEGEDEQLSKKLRTFVKVFKKAYRAEGLSSRYIGGKDRILSAGQIVGTELLKKGFEIVLFEDMSKNLLMGKTLDVQDIEEFSERDYQKPFTDTRMGVLPPKLARIMVNLAEVPLGGMIWDPFCGSGNVLLEGLLLGYDVIGSDISRDAVESTKANVHWLAEKYQLETSRFNVFLHDVTKRDKGLQKKISKTEIGAVVFEPYMGPPLYRQISVRQAKEQLEATIALYKGLMNTLEYVKKPGLKIVAVFPSYKTDKGWVTSRYSDIFSNKWEVTGVDDESNDLHWERSNSIIRRNLLIARLKK